MSVSRRKARTKKEAVVDRGWAWAVMVSCFLIQVLLGLIYSLGMFNIIFLEVFGKDRQTTAWPSAVLMGLFSMTAPVSSVIYERVGLRWTTIIGGLIGSAGFLLTYFATTFVHLFITFGVLIGFGNGIALLPCILAVGIYFKKYRNIAYGLTYAAVGVSTMVLPSVIEFTADYYGWRGGMLIMCGIQLQLVLCGAILRDQDIPIDSSGVTSDPVTKPRAGGLQGNYPSLGSISNKSSRSQRNISEDLGDSYIKLHLSLQELNTPQKQIPLSHQIMSKSHHNLTYHNQSSGLHFYSLTPSEEITPQNGKYNIHSDCDQSNQSDQSNAKTLQTEHELEYSPSEERPTTVCATLKNKNVLILFMNTLVVSIALMVAYVHFPPYFLQQGAAPSEVKLVFTVMGLSNILCRILTGAAINSGEISVLVVYLASGGISSIFILLLPLLSLTSAGRVVFAIGFGFYSNVFNVLLAPVTLELFSLQQLSVVLSVNLVGCGVGGLIGPPMAGWIYDMTSGYTTFIVAGVIHLLGSLCMMLVPLGKHPADAKRSVKVMDHGDVKDQEIPEALVI